MRSPPLRLAGATMAHQPKPRAARRTGWNASTKPDDTAILRRPGIDPVPDAAPTDPAKASAALLRTTARRRADRGRSAAAVQTVPRRTGPSPLKGHNERRTASWTDETVPPRVREGFMVRDTRLQIRSMIESLASQQNENDSKGVQAQKKHAPLQGQRQRSRQPQQPRQNASRQVHIDVPAVSKQRVATFPRRRHANAPTRSRSNNTAQRRPTDRSRATESPQTPPPSKTRSSNEFVPDMASPPSLRNVDLDYHGEAPDITPMNAETQRHVSTAEDTPPIPAFTEQDSLSEGPDGIEVGASDDAAPALTQHTSDYPSPTTVRPNAIFLLSVSVCGRVFLRFAARRSVAWPLLNVSAVA